MPELWSAGCAVSHHQGPGGRLNIKMSSYHGSIGIPMLKIRRSRDRLIFNIRIPIPGKDGLCIETGPRSARKIWRGCSLTIWQRYVLRTRRLRWHGHVERSDGWQKRVQKLNPTGGRGCGRPKKTWTEVIVKDCQALGLITETHPSDRKALSGRFRSAVRLDPPL